MSYLSNFISERFERLKPSFDEVRKISKCNFKVEEKLRGHGKPHKSITYKNKNKKRLYHISFKVYRDAIEVEFWMQLNEVYGSSIVCKAHDFFSKQIQEDEIKDCIEKFKDLYNKYIPQFKGVII